MRQFQYQARNGNYFYCRIEVQQIYNGKRVYKGIMMYGSPGRSRFGKSYREAAWSIDTFENLMLEQSTTDFTPGVKVVREWQDENSIY